MLERSYKRKYLLRAAVQQTSPHMRAFRPCVKCDCGFDDLMTIIFEHIVLYLNIPPLALV